MIVKNIFYKKGGYTVPTKLLNHLKLNIEGLKIKIPYYCVNYLIYLYGKIGKFLLRIIIGKKIKILLQINKCIKIFKGKNNNYRSFRL